MYLISDLHILIVDSSMIRDERGERGQRRVGLIRLERARKGSRRRRRWGGGFTKREEEEAV